jgi:hypothetical protein
VGTRPGESRSMHPSRGDGCNRHHFDHGPNDLGAAGGEVPGPLRFSDVQPTLPREERGIRRRADRAPGYAGAGEDVASQAGPYRPGCLFLAVQ